MDRRAEETKEQARLPMLIPALALAGLVALLAFLAWLVSKGSAPGAP